MKKMQIPPRRHREKGITLLVAMVMLVLVTLLVVTSVNLGKSSLQAVGNMQHRNEVIGATQEALEELMSNKRFFEVSNAVFLNPCEGIANTKCVDVNGDQTNDVKVTLTPAPTCVQVAPVTNLDLSNTEDLGCSLGTQQNFGVAGATSAGSMCADSVWDIRAEAEDLVTETKLVVTQGVSVRVSTDNVATSCP